MFLKLANSAEKWLLKFRNASVSHCFRNSSLTIIWNNLGLSNYEHMEMNLKIYKKTTTCYNMEKYCSVLYSKESSLALMHL